MNALSRKGEDYPFDWEFPSRALSVLVHSAMVVTLNVVSFQITPTLIENLLPIKSDDYNGFSKPNEIYAHEVR